MNILCILWRQFWSCWPLATKHDLKQLKKELEMNQVELAAGLKTLQTQVGKVALEQSNRFDVLSKEIADLKTVIEQGTVTPEVASALADVQTAMQALDDVVPDAPVV